MAEDKNKAPKKLEELSQEELIAKVKELEAEKASLEGLNEELNKELEAKENAPSGKLATFKVGQDTYELTAPKSKFKGKEITAEVLEKDAELLKKLVDIKAGILRPIKKGGDK